MIPDEIRGCIAISYPRRIDLANQLDELPDAVDGIETVEDCVARSWRVARCGVKCGKLMDLDGKKGFEASFANNYNKF